MARTSLKTNTLRNKTIVPEGENLARSKRFELSVRKLLTVNTVRKQLLSACNLSELLENENLIMKYITSSIAQSFNDQLTLAVNV